MLLLINMNQTKGGVSWLQSLYKQDGDVSAADDEVSSRGFIASQCLDIKSDGSGSYKEDFDRGDEGGFDDGEDVSSEDVHEGQG